jgi:trk system potassium uptake protein
VGSSLALELTQAGHTVAVIDRNGDAFRRLGADFSGATVQGIGFDRDRLEEAGIQRAEAVAAVTNGDNSNIVIARVTRETYGVERVVARIYDPQRAAIYQRLGIATVASVAWSAERILRRILPTGSAVEWIDPSARVSLVERMIPSAWAGQPASALEADGTVRVATLSRLGVGQIPRPELVLQEGDVVYVAVAETALAGLDVLLARRPGPSGH